VLWLLAVPHKMGGGAMNTQKVIFQRNDALLIAP
jgi:hypothetical protein